MPLVYSLASSLAHRASAVGIERGDLVQIGVLALYAASDSFDANRGATFGAFAKPFVRGGMLDEIAKHKNESRAVRDKFKRLREAEDKLLHDLMREPTSRELSGMLGIDEQTLSSWRADIGIRDDTSLDEMTENEVFQPEDGESGYQPELSFLRNEAKADLITALGKLTVREQQLLYLYYEEELTLKDIGYVLEVSESQVSRIHKKALARLQASLTP